MITLFRMEKEIMRLSIKNKIDYLNNRSNAPSGKRKIFAGGDGLYRPKLLGAEKFRSEARQRRPPDKGFRESRW